MRSIYLVSLMILITFGNAQWESETYGVENRNGILAFRDQNHLLSVGEQLNKNQQDLEARLAQNAAESCGLKTDVDPNIGDGRLENLPQPNDDALDDCIDKVIKEQKVQSAYQQFENAVGFKSLRAVLQAKRVEATSDDTAKLADVDENGHSFVLLQGDQAVLDPLYRIIIANNCRQLRQDGDHPCQKDTTSAATALILKGAARRLQASVCKTNYFNWGHYYCPSNEKRRIRWGVGHYWWFFKYRAYAYTGCQRRGIFNWWWPTLNWNLARAYGSVSRPEIVRCDVENNLCYNQHTFNTVWSLDYSYGWGFFRTHTVCVPTRTRSGWVRGQHYSSCCGYYYYSALYF